MVGPPFSCTSHFDGGVLPCSWDDLCSIPHVNEDAYHGRTWCSTMGSLSYSAGRRSQSWPGAFQSSRSPFFARSASLRFGAAPSRRAGRVAGHCMTFSVINGFRAGDSELKRGPQNLAHRCWIPVCLSACLLLKQYAIPIHDKLPPPRRGPPIGVCFFSPVVLFLGQPEEDSFGREAGARYGETDRDVGGGICQSHRRRGQPGHPNSNQLLCSYGRSSDVGMRTV